MSPTRLALDQSRLAHAFFVVLVIVGLMTWSQLPIEVFPKASMNRAMVLTFWPGGSALELERLVTDKLERQVSGVRHVKWYTSDTTAGLSRMTVKFDEEVPEDEIAAAINELQSKLGQVSDLPEHCQKPIVQRMGLEEEPLWRICVADPEQRSPLVVRRAAQQLADQLDDLPGIARVNLLGSGDREVRVLLDRAMLERYDLSVPEVAAIIQRSNLSIPAGNLEIDDEAIAVRSAGQVHSVEELAELIIRKDPGGAHVTLGEMAQLEEGLAEGLALVRYQGAQAIVLEVIKSAGTNALAVGRTVYETLDTFRQSHKDSGVEVAMAVDLTPWITSSLDVMLSNLLVGCGLVFLVLWVMLGIRNSVLATIGIPFSFLCTLIGMDLLGITFNTASVFALVLVSGLIVDDAIVVLENVHRHIQEGKQRREAIIIGIDEVIGPVITAALTTVAAFLPLLMVPGFIGKLFAVVPQVVTVALLASLFECLLILPGHMLHWGSKPEDHEHSEQGFFYQIRQGVTTAYLSLLGSLLRLRYLALLVLIALTAIAVVAVEQVRVEPLPSEFPMALISFDTDNQAALSTTDAVGQQLSQCLSELAGPDGIVRTFISVAGLQATESGEVTRQPNLGQIWLEFNPSSTARRDPKALLDILRKQINDYRTAHPDLPLVDFSVVPMGVGLPTSQAVSVRIEGPDYADCQKAADHLEQTLEKLPGIAEVRDNLKLGPRQLDLVPREPTASEFGLTFFDIANSVRAVTSGMNAGQLVDADDQEEANIRVLLASEYRDSVERLLETPLKTPIGARPRLNEVAEVKFEQDYAIRSHYNGRRTVTVSAALHSGATDAAGRPVDLSYVENALREELTGLRTEMPDLHFAIGGQIEEQTLALQKLGLAGLVAALVIYLLLLAQFQDYTKPLLVLLTLIFAFIGVVLGLIVHDYAFSVVTAVALVGLFGVAVNDAIILIDFMRKATHREDDRLFAILEGCRVRLRPILVTTITTVVGLAPMAIGVRGYSSLWSPLAACFCYGLSMATLLTLFFTPCCFMITDDLQRGIRRLFRRPNPTPPEQSDAPAESPSQEPERESKTDADTRAQGPNSPSAESASHTAEDFHPASSYDG